MCGIIGYVGPRDCRDLLLGGLAGWSTAGTTPRACRWSRTVTSAASTPWATSTTCTKRSARSNGHLHGSTGIGHTRWATHGRVTEENAHPHWDTSGRVHIVLNGIVENWTELRDRLKADGAEFTSETDAEVVAHLIATHFDGDLVEAVRPDLQRPARPLRLRRHVRRRARRAGGRSQGVPAGGGPGRGRELHRLRHPGVPGRDPPRAAGGGRRDRGPHARWLALPRRPTAPSCGARSTRWTGTTTPPRRAATRASCSRRSTSRPTRWRRPWPTGWPATRSTSATSASTTTYLRDVRRVVIVACGTSYHAGLVGRYAIETWARRPVEMDIASEFRYREPGPRASAIS